MSFYEPQGWQAPARQPSWEQPPPPSRSGASSSSQREDGSAFATQFEEVDRAIDNLVKSGKFYQAGPRPVQMMMGPSNHRGHGSRHSVSDFDPSRPSPTANMQNFYASQRFQGHPGHPGPSGHPGHPGHQGHPGHPSHQGRPDVDPAFQAKKRMAQARERDLRNYHQEQQYNRSVLAEMSSSKSDRSMSPSTLSEEGRRDLIARQHRALYGGEGATFIPSPGFGDDGSGRDSSTASKAAMSGAARGPSPRGMDPFAMPGQGGPSGEMSGQGAPQELSREKATSPAGQPSTTFGTFEAPGQTGGTTSTPPTGDDGSHARQISKSTTAPLTGAMGPIGSRPSTQQAPGQSLNKRTTSPLPSTMPYAFGAAEQGNERSGSSNSNAGAGKESAPNPSLGAWGTGSGVWGSNKIGATSVWG